MISTYGGVLSAIEKALQELMEEYRGWPRRESEGGDSTVHLLLVYWFCFLFFNRLYFFSVN